MPARTANSPLRSRAPSAKTARRSRTSPSEPSPRRKLEPAQFIPPMKALSVDTVPEGRWRLEVKLDGYRAIAVCNGTEIELWSRNYKPLTAAYPELVAALKKIGAANAVIDGEIVALDEQGRSRFQLLQGRDLPGVRPTLVYYVFDLLHCDGQSLLREPIEERQCRLQKIIGKPTAVLRVSPVFEMKPED